MTQKYSPIVLIERTLGKGIDQRAINRLMELCPSAVVTVRHTRPIEKTKVKQVVTLRGTKQHLARLRATSALPTEKERRRDFDFATHGGSTEVTIAESPELPPTARAIANCSPEDSFCKETGRAMAFNRALKRFANVSIQQEKDARGMGPTS